MNLINKNAVLIFLASFALFSGCTKKQATIGSGASANGIVSQASTGGGGLPINQPDQVSSAPGSSPTPVDPNMACSKLCSDNSRASQNYYYPLKACSAITGSDSKCTLVAILTNNGSAESGSCTCYLADMTKATPTPVPTPGATVKHDPASNAIPHYVPSATTVFQDSPKTTPDSKPDSKPDVNHSSEEGDSDTLPAHIPVFKGPRKDKGNQVLFNSNKENAIPVILYDSDDLPKPVTRGPKDRAVGGLSGGRKHQPEN